MMTREEAEKELIAMLEEAEGGPSYSMEEVDAYMRELLHPKNQIYLTGDTHGQFERIISFCERQQVQPESTFIILGDVGLNYYGDRRDNRGKDNLTKIPITFFCIHGNHEMRPSEELGYQVKEYHGGKVWVQPEYPNLVFAIDGEIYDFFGHSCIVIGGAYSVDKYYRLARGYNWFEDEQPSDEIKEKVERMLLLCQSQGSSGFLFGVLMPCKALYALGVSTLSAFSWLAICMGPRPFIHRSKMRFTTSAATGSTTQRRGFSRSFT